MFAAALKESNFDFGMWLSMRAYGLMCGCTRRIAKRFNVFMALIICLLLLHNFIVSMAKLFFCLAAVGPNSAAGTVFNW